MKDFSRYCAALEFTLVHYGMQVRKNSIMPAVIHPLRVASILRAAGFSEYRDEIILLAALFHDLLEDAEGDHAEIETEMTVLGGEDVVLIVKQLTKPQGVAKELYLESLAQASWEAQVIKLADRIDNLRDMKGWTVIKQRSYAEQANIILRTCGQAHRALKTALQVEINRILNNT